MTAKYQLNFLPLAEEELYQAVVWYEEQRKGLGSRFATAVEAALESVKRTPMLFPKVYQGIRRARVKRFPYGIFFELDGQQIIVSAVYHARRDPRKVRHRR